MKKLIFTALLGALVLISCKKEDTTPETPETTQSLHYVIATATTSANETVTLYSEEATFLTGYNNVYVTVTDANGAAVTDAIINYAPLMTMTSMTHSAPVEQPTLVDNKYKGAVVFTMSSLAGQWSLTVDVNGNPVNFNLTVNESTTKMVGSYVGTDGTTYFISLVRPVDWTVGLNDVEVLINSKASMMSFPADNDFTIVMDPEMISMGHGSPNNISPTLVGNGHYKGVVNYTMTGDWRLHFNLSKNGTEIHSDAFLDILF